MVADALTWTGVLLFFAIFARCTVSIMFESHELRNLRRMEENKVHKSFLASLLCIPDVLVTLWDKIKCWGRRLENGHAISAKDDTAVEFTVRLLNVVLPKQRDGNDPFSFKNNTRLVPREEIHRLLLSHASIKSSIAKIQKTFFLQWQSLIVYIHFIGSFGSARIKTQKGKMELQFVTNQLVHLSQPRPSSTWNVIWRRLFDKIDSTKKTLGEHQFTKFKAAWEKSLTGVDIGDLDSWFQWDFQEEDATAPYIKHVILDWALDPYSDLDLLESVQSVINCIGLEHKYVISPSLSTVDQLVSISSPLNVQRATPQSAFPVAEGFGKVNTCFAGDILRFSITLKNGRGEFVTRPSKTTCWIVRLLPDKKSLGGKGTSGREKGEGWGEKAYQVCEILGVKEDPRNFSKVILSVAVPPRASPGLYRVEVFDFISKLYWSTQDVSVTNAYASSMSEQEEEEEEGKEGSNVSKKNAGWACVPNNKRKKVVLPLSDIEGKRLLPKVGDVVSFRLRMKGEEAETEDQEEEEAKKEVKEEVKEEEEAENLKDEMKEGEIKDELVSNFDHNPMYRGNSASSLSSSGSSSLSNSMAQEQKAGFVKHYYDYIEEYRVVKATLSETDHTLEVELDRPFLYTSKVSRVLKSRAKKRNKGTFSLLKRQKSSMLGLSEEDDTFDMFVLSSRDSFLFVQEQVQPNVKTSVTKQQSLRLVQNTDLSEEKLGYILSFYPSMSWKSLYRPVHGLVLKIELRRRVKRTKALAALPWLGFTSTTLTIVASCSLRMDVDSLRELGLEGEEKQDGSRGAKGFFSRMLSWGNDKDESSIYPHILSSFSKLSDFYSGNEEFMDIVENKKEEEEEDGEDEIKNPFSISLEQGSDLQFSIDLPKDAFYTKDETKKLADVAKKAEKRKEEREAKEGEGKSSLLSSCLALFTKSQEEKDNELEEKEREEALAEPEAEKMYEWYTVLTKSSVSYEFEVFVLGGGLDQIPLKKEGIEVIQEAEHEDL
jgi:hypothetical protein